MPTFAIKLLPFYTVALAIFMAASQGTMIKRTATADCSKSYHKINLAGDIKFWHFDALPSAASKAWDTKICEGGRYGFLHSTPKVEGDFIARLNLHCRGNGGTGYIRSGYIELGFVSSGTSIAKVYGNVSPSMAKVYGNITGKFDGDASDENVSYTATCL